MYYVNVRGVKSKMEAIEEIMEEVNPTVICLTETHFGNNEKIKLTGYHIIYNNRNSEGERGGRNSDRNKREVTKCGIRNKM